MLRKERVRVFPEKKGRSAFGTLLPSLGVSAALFFLSLVLYALSVYVPGAAAFWRRTVYRAAVETIGRLSGRTNVSIAELTLYALVLLLVFGLLRILRRLFRPVKGSGFLEGAAAFFREIFLFFRVSVRIASVLLLLYMAFCGVNYRAPAFSEEAGLMAGESSKEELYALCKDLVRGVNAHADAAELLNDDGGHEPSPEYIGGGGIRSMELLSGRFQELSGFYPRPKRLLFSRLLSVQQLTGIYLPFYIEANYNGEMPVYNRPFTVCHELSHLRGYMREDEANFIAYLACTGSDIPYFRYAGYLSGWVYAGNELYKADRAAFAALYEQLSSRAKADLDYNNRFWDRFEGKAAETQERVNDAYLKSMGEEQGVKSYGRMVDLMLAARRSGI